MRKITLLFVIILMASMVFAGGIVTNTNQSAMYVRTLNRNASTDLDAAYFNPAGLTSLENGLHIHFSNQSILQDKGVKTTNPALNESKYETTIKAPVFPDVYVAYKRDKLVLSGGLVPVGGGGSLEYEKGLPSFHTPLAGLVGMFGPYGATGYKADISFSGSSVYLGFQGNVSYEINDMFSVSAGVRYVNAKTTYEGYMKDVQLDPGGTWMAPENYLYGAAAQMTEAGASLQTAIDGGYSGVTLATLVAGGAMTADQQAQLEGGLVALGIPTAGLTVAQVQGAYNQAAAGMTAQGEQIAAATQMEVDAEQSGTGICVIIGANIKPNDNLNIGVRYETKTALETENKTKVDGSGLFPDGAKVQADMPAMFAAGVSYKLNDKIRLESSLNYYFDTDVDWDGAEKMLENSFEAGLACEYSLSDVFRVSAGYLYATSAATDEYQTDMDFGLDSNTLAFGFGYDLSEKIGLNFGVLKTTYIDTENAAGTEEYYKSTMIGSFGIGYRF